jgi:hypothetical protein
MRRKDIILICFIVLIALGSYFLNIYIRRSSEKDEKTVNIFIAGKLYKTIDIRMRDEVKINTKQGENLIIIDGGKVRMKEASCPDKVCIRMGWISKTTQNIVCLPAKLHIEIAGKDDMEGGTDTIAR